jgi:hypothetical protein
MPKAIVIETMELPDKMWINTRDIKTGAICAICLEKNFKSRTISERDMLQWKDIDALWTPACNMRREGTVNGMDTDIVIKMVGVAGVPRPIVKKKEKSLELAKA